MTHDENPWIRKLTWRRILKARKLHAEYGGVRAFMIPKLNFDADNYYDMVTWMEDVTEPPLTSFMGTAEIEKFIDSGALPNIAAWNNIPCHTQAVERHIKLVTEAAGKVCGLERREGMILSTLRSRSKMPTFETKIQFKA